MLRLKSVNFEQREFQVHQLEKSHPDQTEWVIGRNTTCDLVLASPEVSRVHGRILYFDSSYYFIDVGSASGSVLNGEVVPVEDPRPLQSGDLLQLGETFLHVETLTPPSETEDAIAAPPSTPVWGTEDLICRCDRIINETFDVKTFCFIAEPAVQFNYLPGQFVNLEIEIDGQSVIRPYSISSTPTRPAHLSITVKRVPSPADRPDLLPGLVSNWLHDHLRVGDRVKLIGGAMGHFTCAPTVSSKLLLISAGSGITPMMSMLRWMQDTLTPCEVTFLHSATAPEAIVFRKELEAIAAQMPNLRLAITLTRNPHAWMGLTGRISQSMLSLVAPDLLEQSVFVCGPAKFMQDVRALFEAIAFPMQNYQEESFGEQFPIPSMPFTDPDLEFDPFPEIEELGNPNDTLPTTVHFTQSQQQATADTSTPILAIAERAGIPIRHACRAGACGVCKVKVCKGQVQYQTSPTALSIADQQEGYVLSCIAYPVGPIEIEA